MDPDDRSAVTVRAGLPRDVPELLALWRRAAENDDRPADTAGAVEVLLARDPGALLVAVDGGSGQLVGSVVAGWDGWRAHLYRLAVDPSERRRGVAGLLLGAAEERLRGLGATRFDAMVLEGNEDGSGFWTAHGYDAQPRWRRWVRPA